MGRVAFTISIGVNAGLLSLIATAVLVTLLLEPSEEALGWGLAWAFSLPLVGLLAALASLAHPKYLSATSSLQRVGLYCSLVVTVAGVASVAAYGIFS